MEPNIALKTIAMLDKNQEEDFLHTVESYGPEGIIKEYTVYKSKTKKNFIYKILLTRNLLPEETEFIVYAWDGIYNEDYDIEITQDYVSDGNDNFEYHVEKSTYEKVIEIASRFIHNRWVDHKISNGWRYGLYYSIKNKTDPKLRDWDNLPDEYKKMLEMNDSDVIKFYKENTHLFT